MVLTPFLTFQCPTFFALVFFADFLTRRLYVDFYVMYFGVVSARRY